MMRRAGRDARSTGLFVTNRRHIGDAHGGVQTCTREYLKLLQEVDFDIKILEIDADLRLLTRLKRAVRTSPYTGAISQLHIGELAKAAKTVDFVLLNQVNLAAATTIALTAGEYTGKVVLLSHGAEVTDLLHFIRAKDQLPLSGRLRPSPRWTLENVLSDELASRRGVSAAVCLSGFDADFERWLGVRHTTWIPRTVSRNPLEWNPVAGRFGFLGTLDHTPNLEGLVNVLDAIKPGTNGSSLSVRVVGGPEQLGTWLAERYPSVTYLAALDDLELEREASSWSAFLNPIFCQARGCSTKLATALGWELPIITTPVGRRGYVFSEGSMIEANSPDAFVEAMLSLVNPSRNKEAQMQVALAAKSCPSMADNARTIRPFFDMLMRS
jgi:hypothetical protein